MTPRPAMPRVDLSRSLLFARRASNHNGYRRWTPTEVGRLEALVGTTTLQEMAAQLSRSRASIISKLTGLGYVVSQDISLPLGLSAAGLARRVRVPYHNVWRAVKTGFIPSLRYGRKDFTVPWSAVRRYEAHITACRRRRDHILARIHEPTITKQEFMRLLRLSESHATRYLQGKIVRSWKVPCRYSDVGRERWEWLVSQADAQRVKRLRAAGRLRLGRKAYRQFNLNTAAYLRRMRRAGRLGQCGARGPRRSVIPGYLTVSQISSRPGAPCPEHLYRDIRSGRLPVHRVRVGRRAFIIIHPRSLSAYLKRV